MAAGLAVDDLLNAAEQSWLKLEDDGFLWKKCVPTGDGFVGRRALLEDRKLVV